MPEEQLKSFLYKKTFSKNLTFYLEANGKNQADLCKLLSVSSATASDWCNGKKLPRMDKVQTICNWLNIKPSDLLEEKKTEKRLTPFDIWMSDIGVVLECVHESDNTRRIAEYIKRISILAYDMNEKDLEMVISFMERLKGDK